MTLVAGVDSSTQSCKVVVRDADTGELVRSGTRAAPGRHLGRPRALVGRAAARRSSRPAVWRTSRASPSAGSSTAWCAWTNPARWCATRCCGTTPDRRRRPRTSSPNWTAAPQAWADAVGSVPVAVVHRHEAALAGQRTSPSNASADGCGVPAARLADLAAGAAPPGLDDVCTDRGDASGTGYWSPADGAYRTDLLRAGTRREPHLPRVLGPAGSAGADAVRHAARRGHRRQRGCRAGRRGRAPGDVIVSIGTSGVVSAVSTTPTADPSGEVAGFADATGAFLPLVCTLNAARVLDATARHARASSGRAVRPRAVGAGRRGRVGDGALPRRRADARTVRTPRVPCTG